MPIFLLLFWQLASGQTVLTQGTNLNIDVSTKDGRLAMDLVGSIWILPPGGGAAIQLTDTTMPARRPRWSPEGARILYQTTDAGAEKLWRADVATGKSVQLGSNRGGYAHADWHPDGERIVFSAARRSSGFDLWEMDLQSGIEWRLSDGPGDETQPAWSADGKDLAYIRQDVDGWALVLRPFGQPEIELVVSDSPLASPSWRPDGTLITFLRKTLDTYALHMVILAEPVLERQLDSGEDYFLAPLRWLDRERFYYTADGRIKTRGFDEWRSKPVHFRATIGKPDPRPDIAIAQRELPLLTPPSGKLVIRSTRIFDGLSRNYRSGVDVLIEGGVIESVVPRQDWEEITILDVGDTTLLPGFIDMYSATPDGPPMNTGAELLSFGVTTVVMPSAESIDAALWETEQTPGPRLLRAASLAEALPSEDEFPFHIVAVAAGEMPDSVQRDKVRQWHELGIPVVAESWLTGRSIGASVFLAADALPASPGGSQYQDRRQAGIGEPLAFLSGLADGGTPGLTGLYRSRQASRFRNPPVAHYRFDAPPNFQALRTPVVMGSKPNGLPAGLALHAELRAISAAGLSGEQTLKSSGVNAARLLGLLGKIGQITPGARADLVLVSGDPLKNIADATKIVAVVRNGRFFSLVSLLERARPANSVE